MERFDIEDTSSFILARHLDHRLYLSNSLEKLRNMNEGSLNWIYAIIKKNNRRYLAIIMQDKQDKLHAFLIHPKLSYHEFLRSECSGYIRKTIR